MAVTGSGSSYPRWVDPAIVYGVDLNTLGSQGIARFASTSARSTAITSPAPGQATYVTGTGLQWYDGSNWAPWPGQLMARRYRASGSASVSSETPYMRLDSIPVASGHAYRVFAQSSMSGGTLDNNVRLAFHYRTDGANATAADTLVGPSSTGINGPYLGTSVSVDGLIVPGTGTLSVLLTVNRAGGGGTVLVTDALFYVQYLGLAPAATGVDL